MAGVDFSHVPVIELSDFSNSESRKKEISAKLGQACRDCGFFYVVGHGVSEELQLRIEQLSREFFALPLEQKMEMRMALGGRAWRGYFPVGGELTSGMPDAKEGIYFGEELPPSHPLVVARTPMHGSNLFPSQIPEIKNTVLEYFGAMTQLGHTLTAGLALSLELEETYFKSRYMASPLALLRIFNYPGADNHTYGSQAWGVGEHTDYGFLTILKQDATGGLQVKSNSQWVEAPPVPNSFVCNIGDMLDLMTRGLYRSTPHRVRNTASRDRLSFPFFFDPGFHCHIEALPLSALQAELDDKNERWDKSSVHEFKGTYGDYIRSKVAKVFPELFEDVI